MRFQPSVYPVVALLFAALVHAQSPNVSQTNTPQQDFRPWNPQLGDKTYYIDGQSIKFENQQLPTDFSEDAKSQLREFFKNDKAVREMMKTALGDDDVKTKALELIANNLAFRDDVRKALGKMGPNQLPVQPEPTPPVILTLIPPLGVTGGGGGGGFYGASTIVEQKPEQKSDAPISTPASSPASPTTSAGSTLAVSNTAVPNPAISYKIDPKVQAKLTDWTIAWIDEQERRLSRNSRTVGEQNITGFCIFGVIHVLLLVSVWMAVKEFRHSQSGGHASKTHSEHQEITLSLHKLAVKTSLHGILLLSFSLAFYFLYLKFVFPITLTP